MGRDEAFRQAAVNAGADPDDTRIIIGTTPGTLPSVFGAGPSRVLATAAR